MQNPEKYLHQKLESKFEPLLEEELTKSILGSYIGERINYANISEETRSIKSENDETKLEYEYSLPSAFLMNVLEEKGLLLEKDSIAVRNFKITNKQNKSSFDFNAAAPNSVLLFSESFKDSQIVFAGSQGDKKLFIIEGQPNSLQSIFSLLHEVGHSIDWDSKDADDRAALTQALAIHHSSPTAAGVVDILSSTKVLKSERDAWAYALRVARHVLPGLAKESVASKFIHEHCLGSYSSSIKKDLGLEPRIPQSFASKIMKILKKYFIK